MSKQIAPPDQDLPLHIPVRYALGEYIEVIRELIRLEEAQAAPASASWASRLWNSRAMQKIALVFVVPPLFLVKKALIGDCAFEFTAAGLTRIARRRRASRSWGQVERVHALSRAYMIQLKEGFLPVPYQAFSPQQRVEFLRLLPPGLLEPAGD